MKHTATDQCLVLFAWEVCFQREDQGKKNTHTHTHSGSSMCGEQPPWLWHTFPVGNFCACASAHSKIPCQSKCFQHSPLIFQHLQMHLLSNKSNHQSPGSFFPTFCSHHRGYFKVEPEEMKKSTKALRRFSAAAGGALLSFLSPPRTNFPVTFSWSR